MKKYLALMSPKTKLKCLIVVLLAIISSYAASWWPVKLSSLYTQIAEGTLPSVHAGIIAVLIFAGVYFFAEALTIFRRVFLDCIIADHEAEVRQQSISKLLKMPVAYYSGCLSGEKTAQLNQGVAGFSQLIKITFNDIIATIMIAAATLFQVFNNAPILFVGLMLGYLCLSILISVFQIRSQNGIREKIISQKNSLDGQVCQSINNLELIRSMNAQNYESKRLLPAILNICNTEKTHHRYMGSFDVLKQACKIFFQALILVVSMFLVFHQKMNPGAVITVCLLFQQLIKPIDEVYRFMDETSSSVIKARTLIEVWQSKADDIYEIQTSGLSFDGDTIVLKDVTITNPEKTVPLAQFDHFVIPTNQVCALQGPNGAGKTSLIRSLNRYYPTQKGSIELWNQNQKNCSQQDITDALYYSPQISFFIAGTVRDNLKYGIEREVSDEELMEALKKVHLTGTGHQDTVIAKDPKTALDFMIGEKAEELSGGMKQRLSLARAFLRQPKLFVFDEITANLDQNAAKYVLDSIEEYARSIGAGIVYISHDENVVHRCDQILVLNNLLRTKQNENQNEDEKNLNDPLNSDLLESF